MPIARLPEQGGIAENVNVIMIRYPGIEVDPATGGLLAGEAVAIIPNPGPSVGAADFYFTRCGILPTGLPTNWAGFCAADAAPGASPRLISGRGSMVTPIVTGGVPLGAGNDVFLSSVEGEVSPVPPEPGMSPSALVSLRVGFAISDTVLILTTDAHFHYPGA